MLCHRRDERLEVYQHDHQRRRLLPLGSSDGMSEGAYEAMWDEVYGLVDITPACLSEEPGYWRTRDGSVLKIAEECRPLTSRTPSVTSPEPGGATTRRSASWCEGLGRRL